MTPFCTKPLDAAVAELAGRQLGLLRRHDLRALGMTRDELRHRVASKQLHKLHPGVYAVGHTALTRRGRFLAAVWRCGDGAALSHESAAVLYGWIDEAGDPPVVHVSTTGACRSRPGVVVHRTRHLDHRDVVTDGLLRVTDRVRTLIDLADHLAYPALRRVADHLPSLPTQRLAATAARLPGRAGAGRTQELIHSEDAHTRSELERRFTRYCALHGVPRPAGRNVRVRGVRVDCWFSGARLVVELDSRAHHTRRGEMAEDRRRDRALARAGVDTLRLVWEDLDPGDPLAARDLLQRLATRRR